MALHPLDPQEPVEFPYPEDDDDPTVFLLKPLSGRQQARVLRGGVSVTEKDKIAYEPEAVDAALKAGLVGWRNFGGVEFSGDYETDIAHLDYVTLHAVFNRLMDISAPLDANKKKSTSPPASSSKAAS